MHIDSYSFGKIVVNGKTFSSDVIIYPDRIDGAWWRQEGHLLQKTDLKDIVAAKPDILVVGTGKMGLMRVPEGTVGFLEYHGITVHIAKTGEAVELFNAQPAERKVIGAFHLTC